METSALIAGATGLVGQSLLKQLLEDGFYERIVVLSRRELSFPDKRIKVVLTDFEDLETLGRKLHAHHYFCCLGTTRKKAGSKEAFFQVDYTYCLNLAKMASKDKYCQQFHIVSSMGANAESVIFYNRVKGSLENALKGLQLPALYIYRPSLLLGKRSEKRPAEQIAKFFSALFSFFRIGSEGKRFFAIDAQRVARGMLVISRKGAPGIHTYNSGTIERISSEKSEAEAF